MIGTFIFILGLVMGSFMNVCIDRIPRGESIVYPPSHCTNCGRELKAIDLVPLLSYIFLKGRCRYCKSKLSVKYPLMELSVGIVYLLLYFKYGIGYEIIKYITLFTFLYIIGFIDLETCDIYDRTIIAGLVAGAAFIIYEYFFMHQSILTYFAAAGICGGIIALIIIFTGGMGWGDAELFVLAGLFLGIKLTVLAMFISFVVGGITGLLLVLLKIKSRKDYIPFGPFISISAVIVLFLGQFLLKWYFGLI